MYLKRIEIAGFKSFADRTKIEFEEGVTAVIGPNGSGKSNITEAIRWVLGEQSAKSLRGGKMPDIIFAGSESRKQLNIAEVTVVLDNTDNYLPLGFSEVSVTRRYRRTGESDFFINKKSLPVEGYSGFIYGLWFRKKNRFQSFPKGKSRRFLPVSQKTVVGFLKKLRVF